MKWKAAREKGPGCGRTSRKLCILLRSHWTPLLLLEGRRLHQNALELSLQKVHCLVPCKPNGSVRAYKTESCILFLPPCSRFLFKWSSGWSGICARCVFHFSKDAIVIKWCCVLVRQFTNKYLRCRAFFYKAEVVFFHFLSFFLSFRDQSVTENLVHFIFKFSKCGQNNVYWTLQDNKTLGKKFRKIVCSDEIAITTCMNIFLSESYELRIELRND